MVFLFLVILLSDPTISSPLSDETVCWMLCSRVISGLFGSWCLAFEVVLNCLIFMRFEWWLDSNQRCLSESQGNVNIRLLDVVSSNGQVWWEIGLEVKTTRAQGFSPRENQLSRTYLDSVWFSITPCGASESFLRLSLSRSLRFIADFFAAPRRGVSTLGTCPSDFWTPAVFFQSELGLMIETNGFRRLIRCWI